MSKRQSPFNLSKCARPNILALQPYRCARDDYKDNGTNVLLDANENAFGPGLSLSASGALANGDTKSSIRNDFSKKLMIELDLIGLNRYPDPHQEDLKAQLCALRNTNAHTSIDLTPANLFVGVGSDEAIDALIRCFCVPGKDKLLTCPPTYGMYGVSAQVNDVAVIKVPLDVDNGFVLQPDLICKTLSQELDIKLVYITSPGNPTAALIDKNHVQQILEHPTWNGIVVVDEAYIDFAPKDSSLAEWVNEWPNLVVMQTLSKAFGLAGIRLGAVFTAPDIAQLLNSMKAPYNIPNPTSQLAQQALSAKHIKVMLRNREKCIVQRERLLVELPKIPGIGRFRGGSDANFVLVEILNQPVKGKPDSSTALKVYEQLAESSGVVVRFRGKELGCEGCLRVTVGTEHEVDRFLQEIRGVLHDIYAGIEQVQSGRSVEKVAKEANAIVS